MTRPKPPQPLATAPRIKDWLAVGPNGRITVLSGRVELGQGNLSAIRQIAADELSCDPDDLTITGGHTGQTPDEGFTAGSMSISVGGEAVRWAASALREAVLAAASDELGLARTALSLRDGAVWQGEAQTRLALADLMPVIDMSAEIALLAAPKPASERWQRGRPADRAGLRGRIVGTPFVHDLNEAGCLHGRAVHPPSPHAALLDLDIDALRARPGVVEVVRDGAFVGIIADDPYAAVQAVKWARAHGTWSAPNAGPNDVLQAMAGSEEPVQTVHETGDARALEGQRFETTIQRAYLLHGSIGPSAAVAQWTGAAITVTTHSQGVFQLRGALAMALGLPEDRFVVIHEAGPGCYGHNGADDVAFDAVLMARAVPGRPVKVVWGRDDEFRTAPSGPGMVTTASAVLDEGGRIASMDLCVVSAPHANRPGLNGTPNLAAAAYLTTPILPAPSTDLPMSRGGGADRNAIPLYDIPNVKVEKRVVNGLPYRTSSMRGLGAFANVFAIETLMDDIALEIGEDPIAFRLRHLTDDRARAVIEAVAQQTDAARSQPQPEGSGWGMGFARYKNTSGYCAIMARVEVDEQVRVREVFAAVDIGEVISPDGASNQIEGGIIQSVSWATKEKLAFDGDTKAAETWLDYPILRFSEVPQVHVSLIERMDQPALGCGEVAQGPTAAAVGNAIRAALGVRVRRLPLDRDAILEAMLSL